MSVQRKAFIEDLLIRESSAFGKALIIAGAEPVFFFVCVCLCLRSRGGAFERERERERVLCVDDILSPISGLCRFLSKGHHNTKNALKREREAEAFEDHRCHQRKQNALAIPLLPLLYGEGCHVAVKKKKSRLRVATPGEENDGAAASPRRYGDEKSVPTPEFS